ncbi:pre-toxin TG domain-containing protein, partial [Bacillus pseudomycoides]|nr:pre-toxin TG domain-containing protein [Bacillus pseudomycoides]
WFPQATHWYYADKSGVIQKGNVTYKGKKFTFDRTGKMTKGWIKIQSFDHNIYGSRTILKGYNPQKVGDDEILEVVGEDGPLWFRVNYNGQTYVVKKLFVVVFDQSLSNKMDTIRQDVADLKTATELVKKYSKRLAKTNEKKDYDTAIVESSELAHSISQFLSTLNKSDLKNVIDKINEKEADPAVQVKYQSLITKIEMMEEDFSKIHKLMVLRDSIMVLDKANQDSGNIIKNVQAAKNLIPETKKQLAEFATGYLEVYTEWILAFLNVNYVYPIEVVDSVVTPVENFINSLPQDELQKHVDGVCDYAAELKDWREGFKSRKPGYKQMASDLHKVNKSIAKFADSVETAGAALHKQAVMADELYKSVSTHITQAQQAFPTLHTDIMTGLDAANTFMDSANKIASHKVDVSAAAKNIGNVDLSNAFRELGAKPENIYNCSKDEDLSFILDITPGIGTGKEIGQLVTGKDLVTEKKYGPGDYAWGTLAAVSGGTSRVVGRVFGKVGELEKKAKNLEKAAKGSRSGEIILDKVKTYEQARNQAMDILGDLGTGSKPFKGSLKTSAGYGKVIGRQTADNKARWRLDYDPSKGLHINVEDFRNGKGANAKKYVIPIEGNEETFKSLLKHLNK